VSDPVPLPEGFAVGHWTDRELRTGCSVVLPPAGTRGAVEVRGGGTGTRELEALSPLASAEGPTAVVLTGGSAFGLTAADGVVRWLERRGLGRPTPVGVIPLVPAAVVFDLAEGAEGAAGRRPGPEEGYAACEAAAGGVPGRGRIGAGAGAAVGKVLGRERATPGGFGYAAARLAGGETVAAIAVANAAGDVIAEDGEILGGPRGDRGELLRSAELFPDMPELPGWAIRPGQSTTLACVCTDAALDKRGCGIVARIASAGIARAVDPVFTPLDGDVVFCLASGGSPPASPGPAASWSLTVLGTAAATVTAAAIRDAVRRAEPRP
jgi:L-aminopeptidase/D-esterase-like protein